MIFSPMVPLPLATTRGAPVLSYCSATAIWFLVSTLIARDPENARRALVRLAAARRRGSRCRRAEAPPCSAPGSIARHPRAVAPRSPAVLPPSPPLLGRPSTPPPH